MPTPDTFRKLTDPAIPLQSGTVALNDLLHTVDVSDTTDGAAGTSKRTSVQKIVDVVEANLTDQTLAETLLAGDITDGTDINISVGDAIVVDSLAKLRNGSLDNGYGGGISQECAVGFEQEWENGVQYYFPLASPVVYANSINGVAPGVTFDDTKGYAIGSRYRLLNTGVEYVCMDNATGAADWDVVGVVASVNAGTNITVTGTATAPIINSLADRYKTTSTTSNTIGNGSKSFTVDLDLAYIPLQEILVVYDPSNHMHGEVTSYNAATGALVVDIKTNTGSGTYTSWVLNLDGTPVDALTGSGTANEIAYFTAARVLASLPVATYPSLTELSYVKGVTSSIQTQINSIGSGINYKNLTDQAAVVGTTANTKVVSQLVPANTFAVGDIIEIKLRLGKTISTGITTLRMYINTADSLTVPAATLIATSATSAAANNYLGTERQVLVKSATVTQTINAASSLFSDLGNFNGVQTNSNIDWTVNQYIIFAIQNAVITDSTVISYFQIKKQ